MESNDAGERCAIEINKVKEESSSSTSPADAEDPEKSPLTISIEGNNTSNSSGGGKATTDVFDNNEECSTSKVIVKIESDGEAEAHLMTQWHALISNSYLNVVKRLHLKYPPSCANDVPHCNRYHFRGTRLKEPSHSQLQKLLKAFHNKNYDIIADLAISMSHRKEFPGDDILTKLLEVLLDFGSVSMSDMSGYHGIVEVFNLITRVYPPCQTVMHASYINFIERPLRAPSMSSSEGETVVKSHSLIGSILDILEFRIRLSDENANGPDDALSGSPKTESLTRHLFTALRLLLKILEHDLATWLLHNQKKTQESFFRPENCPLLVLMFELKFTERLTPMVRRLFEVFARAASQQWDSEDLQTLERFIRLLVIASNTADLEYSTSGVRYPILGLETKNLIYEFFRIFKSRNVSTVSSYLRVIDLLRLPYARFEFIDQFLQLFYFGHSDDLSPRKIAYDMSKKRWLKYKPRQKIDDTDEQLPREAYLRLLLDALKAYDEWYGIKEFFRISLGCLEVTRLKTPTESIHHNPTKGTGQMMLKKMEDDITFLEKQIRMGVRATRPTVDLPEAEVVVDEELKAKYRTDLKFLTALNEMIGQQASEHPDEDFNEWKAYLKDFLLKETEKTQ